MRRLLFIVCMFCLSHIGVSLYGQAQEYVLKAVFLEKFSRFITWPNTPDFADTSKPFVISIIGVNVFNDGIDKVYSQQRIKNKKVQIRKIHSLDEIGNSHMLFISYSEQYRLTEILKFVEGRPIVTVGDTKGYGTEGVMINFLIEDKRLRFEINEPVVKAAKVQFSYLLLNQAVIIK